MAGDPPARAGRGGAKPLDSLLGLPRAVVEPVDEFLQRRAVTTQHAECAFQTQGVEHRRREHDHEDDFEQPLRAAHAVAGHQLLLEPSVSVVPGSLPTT